jgi:glycosyltransferase involved in cell wall biosynthesis
MKEGWSMLNESNFIVRISGRRENSFYIDYQGVYKATDISKIAGLEAPKVKEIYLNNGAVYDGDLDVYYFAGIDAAKGEYLAFIDDDDYAEVDFLGFLCELAMKHNSDIAVCGSNKEENGEVLPNGIYAYNELYIMDAKQAVQAYLLRKRYNAAMPTKLVRRELFDKIRFSDTGSYDDISTTYRYFSNAKTVTAHGIPKYTFYRHPGNNSSAATKHHLLNPAQLGEYLSAFRERTEYISGILPQLSDLARYSEWSYMISMVEKIDRFGLTNCDVSLTFMRDELHLHRDEFYNGKYIVNFEKEWMERYIL